MLFRSDVLCTSYHPYQKVMDEHAYLCKTFLEKANGDNSLGDDDESGAIQRPFLSFSFPSFISKFNSVLTKVLRLMKFDRLTVISKVSTGLTATYLNEKEANATSDGQLLSHLIGEVSEIGLDEDGLCSLYELKTSCRKSKSASYNLPRKQAKCSKSPIVSQ